MSADLFAELNSTDAKPPFPLQRQQFGLYCSRMICGERYKYIWNATDIDEFYDREIDPNELTNEISNPEYKDIIADYRLRLLDELTRCRDPLIGWTGEVQLREGRKL